MMLFVSLTSKIPVDIRDLVISSLSRNLYNARRSLATLIQHSKLKILPKIVLFFAAHRKMKPCGVALRVYNNAYLVLSADRVFKYRILPERHANKQIVTEYVCFMHRAVYTNRQK